MKNIAVKNSIVPSKPRSGNYPLGSTVVKAGFGEATVINQEGESVDILKKDDSRLITDSRVMSALRAMDEFISKKNDSNISVIVDWLKGIKLNGKELKSVIQENDSEESSDSNILSSLRTLKEIVDNNEELKKLFLRKDVPNQAAEIIDFLKGWTVGDKASIDKDGIATVQQLIALVKAQVAALEVTGNTNTDSLDVTETATAKDVEVSNSVTTLNAVIQALAKTHDLTVENTADIMNGIIRQYLTSESFVSGFLGSGFKIWKDDNGLWHGELDELTVRKTFLVFELIVQKIVHQGGMVIRSAAGGKLKKVTDGGTYWKCEHDSTDDFVVGDQVLCQTFTGTSMKRYWRLVTSAGAGYFNLSKSDCETGSANPEAGDEVAVLGNRTVTARQKAQIDCAVGDDAPYRDDYSGISSYSLVNKLVCRSGNCAGIVDEVFGALDETVNFYGKGVRLRGSFALESSGKLVEDEISGQISDVRTELEVTAGQISSKVTEATVAAKNADSSATLAQGYASTAGQKASAAAGSASDAANILTTVTQKETSIKQTAQAIELKAVRAESAAGRAESAEASINLKADGIVLQASNQAAKTAVDGVQVGVRNLFRNSKCIVNNTVLNVTSNGASLSVDAVNTYLGEPTMKVVGAAGFYWNYNPIIKANTIYTISMMAKSDTGIGGSSLTPLHIQIPLNDHYYESHISNNDDITTKWKQISITFKSTASTDQLLRCYLYSIGSAVVNIAWIKLEEGNKATDWTPAPEDVGQDATDKANAAEDNAKQYANNTFTTKSTYESGIQILSGQISSKVSQTDFNSLGVTVSSHTSIINQLPTTIDQRITSQVADGGIIKTNVESWFTLSGNTISLGAKSLDISGATVFSSTASKTDLTNAINGVQVGGRNLVRDSNQTKETSTTTGIYWAYFFLSEKLKAGVTYIISCESYERSDQGLIFLANGYVNYGYVQSFNFNEPFVAQSNDIDRISLTNQSINGLIARVSRLKLELGNKATDWTPAPEDVAQDATNKALAAQSNAISAASTDATTKVTASQTALATQLGYSSYAEMTAQAAAGKTIINGGYINTSLINANAIITNDLLATKIAATDITTRRLTVGEGCMVGGFSIGSGRIGISASPENIGNAGMFLYADMIGFNSTNRQAIVGTYSVLGYPRLGQFIDTTSNYIPNVGLVFDINSTNNGGRNYAFVGRGHGVLNGFMCGYAFQELSFTSANQWQEISKLTNVVGVYGNYSNWAVVLPTFASVCNALNISYNTPFQVQITVFCTAAVGSGKFFGRSNSGISGISGNQYPALYNWNADIDDGGYAMGPGDSFQIVLWSSNKGTSSIPTDSGSYRAYIVNKLS